jgi:hypothetical protein
MTEININNYEAYLLDLAEGELSPADEKLLMLFLDKNPDIKAEHDLFELERVSADKIYFENKSDLKKTGILTDLTNSNFEELCIARIEGDLTNTEKIHFDNFIKTDEIKEKEYNLFKSAQFTPDTNKVFPLKHSLRIKESKPLILRNLYTSISIAASIIIVLGMYLFFPKENNNTIQVSELDQNTIVELAEETNVEVVKESIAEVRNSIKLERAIPKDISISFEEKPIQISEPTQRQVDYISYINSYDIIFNFDMNNQAEAIFDLPKIENQLGRDNNAISFRSFLAMNFNKRVLKKENKTQVEIFDIAQFGLEKVNKITGTKMSLERIYDENGVLDRTRFNSRLLAFSAPAKKDKKLL